MISFFFLNYFFLNLELSRRYPSSVFEEIIRTEIQHFIAMYTALNTINNIQTSQIDACYKQSIPKFFPDQEIDMTNREAIRCSLQILFSPTEGGVGGNKSSSSTPIQEIPSLPNSPIAPGTPQQPQNPQQKVPSHPRYVFVEGEHLILVELK